VYATLHQYFEKVKTVMVRSDLNGVEGRQNEDEGSDAREDISVSRNEEEMNQEQERKPNSSNRSAIAANSENVSLSMVMEEISQLRTLFEQRLKYDKAKEDAFNHLYEAFAELKREVALEKYRAVFLDLVLLYDRMEVIEQGLMHSEEAGDALKSLKSELVEVLNRHEVYQVDCKSNKFDPQWQDAVRVEKVDYSENSGRVVRVLRRGFRYRERLLRPEEVVVGRYHNKSNSD